ncbi:hypothetical protein JaAD80_19250 [Janthinobacterium sp. AD80]|nr:hypothetical protein JaAD80_19250 [Janthinobacterium sp. AD80]
MGSVYGNEDMIAHEHRVLMAEYGRGQARCSAQLAAQAARIAQLESELMRARAQVVIRDTKLALAREELAEMAAVAPGLPTRARLARKVEWLSERVQDLMRELLRLQWVPAPSAVPRSALQAKLLAGVREKAVLYVGNYVGREVGPDADAPTWRSKPSSRPADASCTMRVAAMAQTMQLRWKRAWWRPTW